MLKRVGKPKPDYTLTKGPGNLARALGLSKIHTGCNLFSDEIFIEDDGLRYKKDEIAASKRIGVEYAGKDAELLYRFIVKGNPYVSAKS
jgi:DNA-3-methyladenine glycosylase